MFLILNSIQREKIYTNNFFFLTRNKSEDNGVSFLNAVWLAD